MKPSSFISQLRPGLFLIAVHVKPGARSSSLAAQPSRTDQALEVRIGARPVDGQANAELVDFMQTLIEQRLAQCRAASQCGGVHDDTGAAPEGFVRRGPSKKKQMEPHRVLDEKVDYPDKVRVSLVRGGTSKNKVLEISFPGTADELVHLLQSCDA